jgi:putative transposase
VILTYKYRLLPSKRQHAALTAILESQRQLYNAALQERIDYYRKTGKGRSLFDQFKALTQCRYELPEMAELPLKIQRWTLKRLDDTYNGFFRRVKGNEKPGFPRFRGKGRWDSFGCQEFCGIRWDGKRIRFKGLPGGLRVHLHRNLPSNNIRSCVFKYVGKQWWICFQVDIGTPRVRRWHKKVGIDLGLNVFAYQSDGVVTPNPRFSRRTERKIRVRARALSRCRRGSRNRQKVKERLAKLHRKIVDQRTTWLYQQSAQIVKSYDLIAVEDLNVAGMVRNHNFARSISDASWSKFISMLSYKAEKAGKKLVRVNPKNTSQRCSGCDELVPKSLSVRTHSCPHCGLVIDRDWNAAKNILRKAVVGLGERNVAQWGERARRNLDLEVPN